MSFTGIFIIELAILLLYYAYTIIHDLYFSGQGVVKQDTVDEEEIDITEEAKEVIQPAHINKDNPYKPTVTPVADIQHDDTQQQQVQDYAEATEQPNEQFIATEQQAEQDASEQQEEKPAMTGAIDIDDLMPMVEDYAQNSQFSNLHKIAVAYSSLQAS